MSTFGQNVDSVILKQIKARETVFGKEYKTAEDLLLTTANAPWIVLRSGVDTPVPGKATAVSPKDAKRCVLVGGSALLTREGLLKKRGGITTGTPAYNLSETQGWRPMPGITGIHVKPKDTWGIISEAEISVQVWSREDLELIDKLYFKPGMVALLEWGHSVWVDNNGKIQETTLDTILNSSKFFVPQEFSMLDDQIRERKQRFNGNYEACFGYITNFSYAFNEKGGWDCTIHLLSKSSVLEGLTIKKAEGESRNDTSEYHRLFKTMIEQGVGLTTASGEPAENVHRKIECTKIKGLFDGVGSPGWNVEAFKGRYTLYDCQVTLYTKTIKLWDYWFKKHDKWYTMVYLSLADLLLIVQAVNNIRDTAFPARGLIQFDLESHNKYNSFEGHTSINPYIAALPRWEESDWQQALTYGTPGVYLDTTAVEPHGYSRKTGWVGEHKDNCEILNIMVSANHFLDLIDREVSSKTENFSLFDVLTAFLKDIQKALGNVNDFYLQYDSGTDLWSIVDHNLVNRTSQDEQEIPIRISGPSTTIQKLEVNSAVSPSIANEMAIAAQAPAKEGTSTEASSSLVFWNEGCVNRHKISGPSEEGETSKPTPVETEEWIDEIGIFFNRDQYSTFRTKLAHIYGEIFNGGKSLEEKDATVADITYGVYNDLQLPGESLYKRLTNRDAQIEGSKVGGGVLPVKLELDMLGLGGFTVGTSFTVTPGILLDKYRNWGNIITGIEHTVRPEGWSTHLKTQYYPNMTKVDRRKCYGFVSRDTEEIEPEPNRKATNTRKRLENPEVVPDVGYPAMYWAGLPSAQKWYDLGGINLSNQPVFTDFINAGLITSVNVRVGDGSMTRIDVHKAIVKDVEAIFNEIYETGFKVTGKIQTTRSSTDINSVKSGISRHEWGIAIDINKFSGNFWFKTPAGGNQPMPDHIDTTQKVTPATLFPKGFKNYSGNYPPGGVYNPEMQHWSWDHPVVQIFLRHGWGWGGAYGDTMHFSLDTYNLGLGRIGGH